MSSKLSLYQSIPLGIGSIIGSGILFLPSLTYKVSGSDVLLSWLIIILMCYPGIIFFNEIIKKLNPENTSLSGMIGLGLGSDVGSSVHLILLGTVVFGMPSAAIVAGTYCAEVFSNPSLKYIVSFMLILFSLLVNFFGLKTSSIISFIISAILVIVSVYLISATIQPIEAYKVLKPELNLGNIYSGSVLSFWAFAGFENLTFLYDKFKNPRRDLLITIFVSITVCGLLYLGLVANYASIVPYFEIKETTGLLQMADYAKSRNLGLLIAFFAIFCVSINLVSWTGGVIQLIIQAGKLGVLPKRVSSDDKKALLFLGILFNISLIFGLYSQEIFSKILTGVSTNFLVLYLLTIISYIKISSSNYKKILASLISIVILVTLTSSSYMLIYPFVLFLASYISIKRTSYED